MVGKAMWKIELPLLPDREGVWGLSIESESVSVNLLVDG